MEAATHARSMSTIPNRVTMATRIVALVLGIGYVVSGIVGAFAFGATDGSDTFWWLLLLVGGGALVLAGAFVLDSRRILSVAVTIVGALAGALALFWSVVAPVLAIVLALLTIVRARRISSA
jgi:hypothetical protein